uniref:CSON005477 protein n=1 Tax=Culicoides sonorensis TaxID=179676 RepID=A0A336MTD9_CULSO
MLFLFILVLNIILCFIFILFYLEYQRRSLNRQFSHISGPGQYPVIGNLLGFTCSTKLTDLNCYVDELSKASIVKLIVPGHMILGISDPQILQEILNSSEFLGRVKYFLKFTPWKEAMLTAACPTMWRSLRKAIQPAFSHKNLVSIIPTFNMHLHKFKERINEYADSGKAFDFFSLSDEIGMKQALDTILNITEVDSNLMHDMFKKIVDYTCERLVRIDQHPDFIYHRTQKYLECHKIFIKLKKIFDEALTRTLNEQNNNCKKNVLYYLLKKGKSDNQKELSTVQIMDNALIMFGATSSSHYSH